MTPEINAWLRRDPDPTTRRELEDLIRAGDTAELSSRFGGRLAFGTAGLRAVVGAGPLRMNRLVVRETSAGLARYVAATLANSKKAGIIVGYDGRTHSKSFAEDAACVFAAEGFRVLLADRPTPTPICAFALREVEAAAAVVITASHNPPEYNGYKVYWQNGAQIIPPHDRGIADAIAEAAKGDVLPFVPLEEALTAQSICYFGEDIWSAYLEGIARLSVHPGRKRREELVIAYTPLHGVGADATERALARAGFAEVYTAASQREPDGTFPTVRFPNPEEPGAMDAVLALAREKDAALAIANDPDADRLAVAVREEKGSYRMLTGDQIGVLLGLDRLDQLTATERESALFVTTVVSSRLLGRAAEARGARYLETLTGFKWIINNALTLEAEGARFVFGYEEALGYCVGDLVRDKDGISAAVAFAELTASLARDGRSVIHFLDAIYRAHGVHLTRQVSIALPPHRPPGAPSLGDSLRANPPAAIGGRPITDVRDLSRGEGLLAPSDVLIYTLGGDARVIVRPSGTEPKLKCYYEVCEPVEASEEMADAQARAESSLRALIEAHQAELSSAGLV